MGLELIVLRPVARMEESSEDFMEVNDVVGVTKRRIVVRWDLKRRVHWLELSFYERRYVN